MYNMTFVINVYFVSKVKYIIQSSLKAQGLWSSCLSITRAFNQDFRFPLTFHMVAGEPHLHYPITTSHLKSDNEGEP